MRVPCCTQRPSEVGTARCITAVFGVVARCCEGGVQGEGGAQGEGDAQGGAAAPK